MNATAAPTRPLRHRKFTQVDVFTEVPFRGNPVAVVLDAEGLDTEAMQSIARWTNLSETAFVLPARSAAANYRVRIFTPRAELPFAGHPTIGTAHAVLEAGVCSARNGVLVQECDAGLVRLEQDAQRSLLWLTMPAATLRALDAPARALLDEALGAPVSAPLRVDLGPAWIVARLRDARTVLDLTPDLAVLRRLSQASNATGVTVFGEYPARERRPVPPDAARSGADASGDRLARYEVRSFAPAHGIDEDPVCGSGNGSVAAYLAEQGQREDYLASQGAAVGRDGIIAVRYRDDGAIAIGGAAVSCIRGEILA
jgi:PhzF family phenazine biosynthesis protein